MAKKNEVIPADEIKEHKTRIEQLTEQMSAIKVTSQEELTQVATYIGEVKKVAKAVKEARDKYIAPAQAIIDQAKGDFDPIIRGCLAIETMLKGKAQQFMDAEDKRIEEAKKKEIAKVESGYQKPETAVEKISEMKTVAPTVEGGNGKLVRSKVKEGVIENEALIPEEYWIPRKLDLAKIQKVIKAGGVIPGVKVIEKSQMGMRAN